MAMIKINWNPAARELRWFAGLWFPAFFLLVASILWLRFNQRPAAAGVCVVAIIVAAVGIVRPASVRILYVAWMAAAYPVGWLMAHLVLAGIFFLVITPMGLTMRLGGRDPLTRRWEKSKSSYWVDRPADADDRCDRYFRPF